ncbi:MAG TPA: DUF3102 domain-containing protein [Pseudolabrys sp.]
MSKKPKAAARELVTIAAEILDTYRVDTQSVIKRGDLLIEAKSQLKHGQWLPWLEENFSMDARTAQRAMAASKFAAKYDTRVVFNLTVDALYELSGGDYSAEFINTVMTEAEAKSVSAQRIWDIECELAPPQSDSFEEIEAQMNAEAEAEEQREAEEQAEAEKILDGAPPDLPPTEPPKRELPAKLKINGQQTATADFSPAAQAQIVAALAKKQTEHVIANLPASWDTAEERAEKCEPAATLQPTDGADTSAEQRKAEYAAAEQTAKQRKEHFRPALILQAEQAEELAGMFHASYQECPSAISADAIEAVHRALEAWSKIAQEVGRGTDDEAKAAA